METSKLICLDTEYASNGELFGNRLGRTRLFLELVVVFVF